MNQTTLPQRVIGIVAVILITLVSAAFTPSALMAIGASSSHVTQTEPEFVDVFLIIDNSGSMTEFHGAGNRRPPTDPEGYRLHAAELFVEYLNAQPDASKYYKAGIIHLGDTNGTHTVVPLTNAEQYQLLMAGIYTDTFPCTDFSRALTLAESGFEQDRASRKAIVLLTDGIKDEYEYCTGDTGMRRLEKHIAEIRETGIEIYVIGIGAAVQDAAWWQQRVDRYDSASIDIALLSLYDELGGEIITPYYYYEALIKPTYIAAGEIVNKAFVLEPYLEQATFSIIKNHPGVTVTICRVGGDCISCEQAGVRCAASPQGFSEIITLQRPEPGQYTVRSSGGVDGGTVLVNRRWRYLDLELVPEMERVVPVGESLNVAIRVLDDSAQNVLPDADQPYAVRAVLSSPYMTQQLTDFKVVDGSILEANLPALLDEGEYSLDVELLFAGEILATAEGYQIEVAKFPPQWKELSFIPDLPAYSRVYPAGKPLAIEAQLLTPDSMPPSPSNSFKLSVVATVRTPGGNPATIELADPENDGVYTGSYPETMETGDYQLAFIANSNGHFLKKLEGVTIRVQPLPYMTDLKVDDVEMGEPLRLYAYVAHRDLLGDKAQFRAEVKDGNSQVITVHDLVLVDFETPIGPALVGEIPGLKDRGAYSITMNLRGESIDGLELSEYISTNVQVGWWWWFFPALGGLGLLLISGMVWLSFIRPPAPPVIVGTLSIEYPTEKSNRKWELSEFGRELTIGIEDGTLSLERLHPETPPGKKLRVIGRLKNRTESDYPTVAILENDPSIIVNGTQGSRKYRGNLYPGSRIEIGGYTLIYESKTLEETASY